MLRHGILVICDGRHEVHLFGVDECICVPVSGTRTRDRCDLIDLRCPKWIQFFVTRCATEGKRHWWITDIEVEHDNLG